jgi:hypothetical protein
VIIDELTRWKAALCTRNNNLQLCIQGLLDEMNSIQNHQNQTYKYYSYTINIIERLKLI